MKKLPYPLNYVFRRVPKKIKEALLTIVGVIFVWRGMWVSLDALDRLFFGGSHLITGIMGFAFGIALLYYLDNDLEELRVI